MAILLCMEIQLMIPRPRQGTQQDTRQSPECGRGARGMPVQAGIRQYIHYYNHERIKVKLESLGPVLHRAQAFST